MEPNSIRISTSGSLSRPAPRRSETSERLFHKTASIGRRTFMKKSTIVSGIMSGVGVLALSSMLAGPAAADEKLNIVYTHHSSASNPFWQAVKKGVDDACAQIQANCQMIFTQTEGSIDQEVANQQAALACKPDALITTLID